MQSLGGLLVFLGLGSFVLNWLGREFVLIMWIDLWGPTVGLIIRIAMIVVGAALWFAGNKSGDEDEIDGAGQEEA